MTIGGFIALLIGLTLWGFIIFSVVLAIREESRDSVKEKKEKRKNSKR